MIYTSFLLAISLALFAGMLLCLDLGRRFGIHRMAQDPEGAHSGTGAVDGAVFALLGLLIAFTFSGAAGRFDERRSLIVEETNDIGTAYLRLDLLPAGAQPALRDLFRRYLDASMRAQETERWWLSGIPIGSLLALGALHAWIRSAAENGRPAQGRGVQGHRPVAVADQGLHRGHRRQPALAGQVRGRPRVGRPGA